VASIIAKATNIREIIDDLRDNRRFGTLRLSLLRKRFIFQMRYVAAYLLAVLGGKTAPASGDIEKILSSVGIEVDTEKLKKVLSELNGKSIDDLLTQGTQTSKIPLFTVLRDDYTQHHLSYESV
jgi:hypothetical protein